MDEALDLNEEILGVQQYSILTNACEAGFLFGIFQLKRKTNVNYKAKLFGFYSAGISQIW